MPSDPGHSESRRARVLLALVLAYTLAVLGADTLAALGAQRPWDWSTLRWFPFAGQGALSRFDAYKFLFWFVIPFACCIRWMDWGAWGVRRWKKWDAVLLAALALAGVAAMALIPLVPSLREVYGGGGVPPERRATLILSYLVWDFSWLLGWEFLHRYVLLRAADRCWPRFGWLIVPFSEGLYHLQKPGLEAVGMVALSLVLTFYARRRKNFLLPFLAHLLIEVELILFLAFFAG